MKKISLRETNDYLTIAAKRRNAHDFNAALFQFGLDKLVELINEAMNDCIQDVMSLSKETFSSPEIVGTAEVRCEQSCLGGSTGSTVELLEVIKGWLNEKDSHRFSYVIGKDEVTIKSRPDRERKQIAEYQRLLDYLQKAKDSGVTEFSLKARGSGVYEIDNKNYNIVYQF
jgi:hypothetical protein